MTFRDIINILKSYAITTNVTWDTIKYDADKAIYKINDYMGTKYPKMSDVLKSDKHTYSVMVGNKSIPIFPERYILSIVIPYIASEILAREEEFTTVYNKYIVEVEDGLFSMFQNEFNRVPPMFQQSCDDGVFFENQLPTQKPNTTNISFKVYYHDNLGDAAKFLTKPFNIDINSYVYGDTINVQSVSETTVIDKEIGCYCYKFLGWTRDPRIVNEPDLLNAGSTIDNILSDVHLYAVWDKQLTVEVNSEGVFTIKTNFIEYLDVLVVPSVINGIVVKTIPEGFFDIDLGASLNKLVLPKTLETIEGNAFNGYKGIIIFPKYNSVTGTPQITIKTGAFTTECEMEYVYLPMSVYTIERHAFRFDTTFYCQYSENNAPESWYDNVLGSWHTDGSTVEWEVSDV